MHSLGSMEGYLSTLNKMTTDLKQGREQLCLLGEAPR